MSTQIRSNSWFHSIVVIDVDGSEVGVYRKSCLPNGPGTPQEQRTSPDTTLRVFKTHFATLGVGIGSDQWYPEFARVMSLMGADFLLYPTSIGSEPHDLDRGICAQWQRCMQGHASVNIVPVITANQVGKKLSTGTDHLLNLYSSSFMTDHVGSIVVDAGRNQEKNLMYTYNMDDILLCRHRAAFFRGRRPDLYSLLCLDDSEMPHGEIVPQPSLFVTEPSGIIDEKGAATEAQRHVESTSSHIHTPSFYGEMNPASRQRPRLMCRVCKVYTIHECRQCDPGPVALCVGKNRSCWIEYHRDHGKKYGPSQRKGKKRQLNSGR